MIKEAITVIYASEIFILYIPPKYKIHLRL